MEQDRVPRNLQGVLQLAIANSKNDEAPEPSKYDQLDEERKQFLENALKSMTVDVVEELEKSIRTLEDSSSSVEAKVEAINVIRDYADHIDFANSFISVGGSKVVIDCLNSNDSKLKTSAAYLLAELSQNNPVCQKHFLSTNVLQLLMMYSKDDGDVASSAMHAISSLVRSFEEGTTKFIELGGLESILERLHTEHGKVFLKACFLLRALAVDYVPVRDKFVKLGAVQRLATFVEPVNGFEIKIETVLSALQVLAQSEEGKRYLREANITDTLQTLIEINIGKAECQEMLRDSEWLLDCIKE